MYFLFFILALLCGLEKAMHDLHQGRVVPPYECHRKVKALYNWINVTERTEKVYKTVTQEPVKDLGQQLRR